MNKKKQDKLASVLGALLFVLIAYLSIFSGLGDAMMRLFP
jgi:uncharacterized membrane protein (DUF106 family)